MRKCNKDCETCPFFEPPYCLWFLSDSLTLVDQVVEKPNWVPLDYTDLFGEDINYFPEGDFSFLGSIFKYRIRELNKEINLPLE